MKKVFSESLISEMKPVVSESSKTNSPVLCVVEGACFQFGKVNRNNRIYSRKLVEDRILNNPIIQESLKNRSMLGEGGHPENRVDISYPEVALAVEKLWIPEGDGDMLWGRFAILNTPIGRILNELVKYGTKLGISARAMADSVQKDGHEVILENSYELITFDAVTEPGFKCARLEKVEAVSKSIDQMSTKELKESSAALKSFKNPVFESRIRTLDKEISKREGKADLQSIVESVNKLSNALSTAKSLDNIKYEKQFNSLINEAKSLVDTLKSTKRLVSESSINESISIKHNTDSRLDKFADDNRCNESVNISNLFVDKKESLLEKMCLNFRRNIHE